MTLVLDRPLAAEPLRRDDDDIAAWTRRWSSGRVETWRADGLACNPQVTTWAAGALSSTRRYADLLYRELTLLT